jgi:LAO/AO transport system kinase
MNDESNKSKTPPKKDDIAPVSMTQMVKGVPGGHDGMPGTTEKRALISAIPKRQTLSADDYVDGVIAGERTILARAITLVESNYRKHQDVAQSVLKKLLPRTGQSIRVGITGVPGVGKSTFIDALGMYLLEKGKKVAVLAIDPSSTLSGGSILGDKTRMERLSRDDRCFIRPSPSSGILGGVTRKSRETMLVCESAGFDVILIETVGVGQSEVTVRSMVDFFLLLMISGAGDELQGIKRGIVELADALLLNKADGENRNRAELARCEYEGALQYLLPATPGWQTRAYTCSSLTGEGIEQIWETVEEFQKNTMDSGAFAKRREKQSLEWFRGMIGEHLMTQFSRNPKIIERLPAVEELVAKGEIPVVSAVEQLIALFQK